MAEVASLGIKVETAQVRTGMKDLDGLSASAQKAGKSVDGVTAAAAKANTGTGQMSREVGRLSQMADSLGGALSRVHPAFGLLTAGALGVTVVLGGAVAAFQQMSAAALALADRAGKLKDFSETTSFTTTQLQALERAGEQVGVSAEQVARGLERFSVSMDDIKKAAGPAYESILEINPALANQFTQVGSLADAWDIFAKAIKSADLEQANKLARSVFGREGVPLTRLLRANADSGGLASLVKDLEKVGLITEKQADQWDTLGDAIASNSRKAKENIASIFTGGVLTLLDNLVTKFLEFSVVMRNFTLGDGFTKFMEWSKSPAGMAILAGGAGAALGGMVAGPVGALVGGTTMGMLGLAKGVEYQNNPSARVPVTGGTVDPAATARVAEQAALEKRKADLSVAIKDQERMNAAIGGAVTPLQLHTLGLNKLELSFRENKLQMQGTQDQLKREADATKAYEKAVADLNAQFKEQQFATRGGILDEAPSVADILAAAKTAVATSKSKTAKGKTVVSNERRLPAAA